MVGSQENGTPMQNNATPIGGTEKTGFFGDAEKASRKKARGVNISKVLASNPALREKRLRGVRAYFARKKAERMNPEAILLRTFEAEYGVLPKHPSDKVQRRYSQLRQVWLRYDAMKKESKSNDMLARQEIRLFRFAEAYASALAQYQRRSDDEKLTQWKQMLSYYNDHPAELIALTAEVNADIDAGRCLPAIEPANPDLVFAFDRGNTTINANNVEPRTLPPEKKPTKLPPKPIVKKEAFAEEPSSDMMRATDRIRLNRDRDFF